MPALRSVPDTKPRAWIYVRQSIAKEESASLSMQETAGRDYCGRMGYEVAGVVCDEGVSGLKWEKRPGIQEVMRRVAAAEVDVVIVWRWSRLSRRTYHQALALHAIEQGGARVESATEPFDTATAGGEFGRNVMLAAAHFESQQKAEQWRETHARRRAEGKPAQGGDRYGYTRQDGSYVPHEAQAEVVRWCYEQYISGRGFVSLCGELARRGELTRLGRPWSSGVLSRYMDAGFAAGVIVHGKEHFPGAHPPIITGAVWAEYRRQRQRRTGTAPRVVEPRYPLTGLIRCGECNASMWPAHGGTKITGHRYECGRWRATRTGRAVSITRAAAERAVLAEVRKIAADVTDAAEKVDSSAERAVLRARADAKAAAREVIEIDRRLTKLTQQLVAGVIPEVAYAPTRDELLAAREAAEAQRVDAEHALEQRENGARPQVVARSLVAGWETLPLHTRRDLLAELFRRVEVHPPEVRGGRAWVRPVPVWEDD